MKNISKKEIRDTVKEALAKVASHLEIAQPSKRTLKLFERVSKKISSGLKNEIKKKSKKALKLAKSNINGKQGKVLVA